MNGVAYMTFAFARSIDSCMQCNAVQSNAMLVDSLVASLVTETPRARTTSGRGTEVESGKRKGEGELFKRAQQLSLIAKQQTTVSGTSQPLRDDTEDSCCRLCGVQRKKRDQHSMPINFLRM